MKARQGIFKSKNVWLLFDFTSIEFFAIISTVISLMKDCFFFFFYFLLQTNANLHGGPLHAGLLHGDFHEELSFYMYWNLSLCVQGHGFSRKILHFKKHT